MKDAIYAKGNLSIDATRIEFHSTTYSMNHVTLVQNDMYDFSEKRAQKIKDHENRIKSDKEGLNVHLSSRSLY